MNPFPNQQLESDKDVYFLLRIATPEELKDAKPGSGGLAVQKHALAEFKPVDLPRWLLDTFQTVVAERSDRIATPELCTLIECTRQSSYIARSTRRGAGNHLYLSADDRHLLPEGDVVRFRVNLVEGLLPPRHILCLYVGDAAMDVGFLYSPEKGLLENRDCSKYGCIVKVPE